MTATVVDPIGAVHAVFEERFEAAEEGVRLRVFQWTPKGGETADPLVFVSGWVSIVDGWADFLRELTTKRPVFYIETREKQSAEISRKGLRSDDFSLRRMGADLVNVCKSLPIDMERSVVAGSSLGATALLEALKKGALETRGAFLIGPNSEIKGPPVVGKVIYLPAFLYHGFKYLLLWYLRTFRVDVKKEPEQMARYNKTLLTAHPRRLQLSAISATKYNVWSDLETIEVPVTMAYAASDKLHSADGIDRLATTIPRGCKLPCESNKYMHSAALAADVERFIASLDE